MYAQNRNVTYISDLPELEDIEPRQMYGMQGMQQGPPGGMPEKFKKFIRPPMTPLAQESGMNPYQPQVPSHEQYFPPPQEVRRPSSDSPTCLEISDHVGACPICSRFYKNDHSIYIIAIVVLSILCLLLLKRVLNL